MRNSESAYLFTYNYFWKLVSISIISAVLFLHLFNTIRTNKQTNKQTDKSLRFNYIDLLWNLQISRSDIISVNK